MVTVDSIDHRSRVKLIDFGAVYQAAGALEHADLVTHSRIAACSGRQVPGPRAVEDCGWHAAGLPAVSKRFQSCGTKRPGRRGPSWHQKLPKQSWDP